MSQAFGGFAPKQIGGVERHIVVVMLVRLSFIKPQALYFVGMLNINGMARLKDRIFTNPVEAFFHLTNLRPTADKTFRVCSIPLTYFAVTRPSHTLLRTN